MSYGHAEWIGNFTLGHRLWETAATFVSGETSDIIARPERPVLALVPLALALAALALLAVRGDREERRAAAMPLQSGAGRDRHPAAAGAGLLRQGLRPRPQPAAGAGAAAGRGRDRGDPAGGAPPRRVVGAALLAYSLGFCVWVSFSPDLQRPDWDAVAARLGEPEAPRATVTWMLGEAPLRYYLSTGAIQVRPADGYDWLVHEVDFVSDGKVPPPPARLLGPGFRETAREDAGRLYIRHYELPGPGLAPLRLRELRRRRSQLPQQRRPAGRHRPR